jgi:hypothetical protein
MSANFGISVRMQVNVIHVNLIGDFDGSSAFELLHLLKEYCGTFHHVHIHTDGLNEIHRFGREVFFNNLRFLNCHNFCVRFEGEKTNKLAPFWSSDSSAAA